MRSELAAFGDLLLSCSKGMLTKYHGKEYVLSDKTIFTTETSKKAFAEHDAERKKESEEEWALRKRRILEYPPERIKDVIERFKGSGYYELKNEDLPSLPAEKILDIIRTTHGIPWDYGLDLDLRKEVIRRGKKFLEEIGWPTDPSAQYRNIHNGSSEPLWKRLSNFMSSGLSREKTDPKSIPLSWENVRQLVEHWEPDIGINWPKINRLEQELQSLLAMKEQNPGKTVVKNQMGKEIKVDEDIANLKKEIEYYKEGKDKKNGQPSEVGFLVSPKSPSGLGSRQRDDTAVEEPSEITPHDEAPTKIRPQGAGKSKLKAFGEEKIVHYGVKDALAKGLITSDQAAVIDGILESFPEAWREHFEPRFSEQAFAPTGKQASSAGFTSKELREADLQVKSILLEEKIGPLKEDAKHLAVMFKGSDVLDFIHEFGEFVHARLLTPNDVSKTVNPLYEEYKNRISKTKEKKKERNEWFSDNLEKWWLDRKPVPPGLSGLFRKVLKSIKGISDRLKGIAPVPNQLKILFDDIVTNGRDINSKYYYTDAEVLANYIVGTDPTAEKISEQGFSRNAKTVMSWDPSTLCPKQDRFIQFMVDRLRENDLPMESLLDLDVLAGFYDMALQAGIDVPCSYCYVEQARRKAISDHLEGKPITGVHYTMAKQIFRSVPYTDKILSLTDQTIEALNKRGGLRLFSFSDYIRAAHHAEVDRLLSHAKQRGLSIKAITKNPDFVEDFADRGILINVSIDMAGEGMDWDKAAEFKSKYPNVKVRSVALNLEDVVALAELSHGGHEQFVDVITPYHHDNPNEPIPAGYEDMSHDREGGKKLYDLVLSRPDLRLAERTCCVVGGKCFSTKHNKQCGANCGNIAGNLSVPLYSLKKAEERNEAKPLQPDLDLDLSDLMPQRTAEAVISGNLPETGRAFNPLLPEPVEALEARPQRSRGVPEAVASGRIESVEDFNDVLKYHTKEEQLLKHPTMWLHLDEPNGEHYLIVLVNIGNRTTKPYGYHIDTVPKIEQMSFAELKQSAPGWAEDLQKQTGKVGGKVLKDQSPITVAKATDGKILYASWTGRGEVERWMERKRDAFDQARQRIMDLADQSTERNARYTAYGPLAGFSHYSLSEEGGQGAALSVSGAEHFEKVSTHLGRILSRWKNGPEVMTVQRFSDLPIEIRKKLVRQSSRRGGRPEDSAQRIAMTAQELASNLEGFVYEGKVYLITDNLDSSQRAEQVLAHEVIGHYGIEAVLGDKFDPFLREVVGLYGKKGLREISELYGFDLETEEGRMRAAKEKIAQMAEDFEKPGFLRRLYAAVRDALRRLGFRVAFTDADIHAALTRASDYVGGKRSIFDIPGLSRNIETSSGKSPTEASILRSLTMAKQLLGMNPVPVSAKGLEGLSGRDLRTKADELYRQLSTATNKIDGKTVRFVHRGLREMKAHSADERVMKIVPDLKTLFEKAVPLWQEKDDGTHPGILMWHNYGVRTNLNGEDIVVRLLARETKGGHLELYHFDADIREMQKAEKAFRGESEHLLPKQGLPTTKTPFKDRLLNWLASVNRGDQSGGGEHDISMSRKKKPLAHPDEVPIFPRKIEKPLGLAKLIADERKAWAAGWEGETAERPKAPPEKKSWRERITGEPKENLQIVFGENGERDLREFNDSFRIPAWIAKTNKTVKRLFDRQNQRDKDRSKLYHDLLDQTKMVFDLTPEQTKEFSKLAFGLENKKVVKAGRFLQVGQREIAKGFRLQSVMVPVYQLNADHYNELARYLEDQKVSKPVRDAYVATRKALDQSLIMIWDRLAEIRNIDPTLIEEYRNQIGSIDNYFPHNRYGNFHIRAIDPNAKSGEKTKFRMHFNAINETHAQWWANRNIDRIQEELKKEHPEVNWDSFQWQVDKNRELPEEIYDYPIPVDAMQAIIDSAADRMPDDIRKEIKNALSEEVSNVLKSRGFGSHMIRRKDIPGYEKNDPSRVLHDHFAGFSGWLTKMEAAHDFGEILRGIDALEKPNEYKWGTRFVQDMLQNQTKFDRVVDGARAIFFLKYLGGNIKTAVVNLTQNIISGIPRLAMEVGVGKAGQSLTRAMHDMVTTLTREKIEGATGEKLNKDEARFLKDMFDEGWGQAQLTREVSGKIGGQARKIYDKVSRVMGFPMEVAERFNRMSLGLAAFRQAAAGGIKNQKTMEGFNAKPGDKLAYADAKRFAERVVNDAHFIYGKGNRPAFLRGSAFGKGLSTAYTFRSFSHNLLSMWRWMLTQEGREGQKAFAYSVAGMIALGGLGAAPLYGMLAGLIRQLFGEDPLESGVRKQLPPGMRDLVMYGAPSILGVNIGGSIGMEVPILERVNVNRSWSEQMGQSMGELLGIPYAVMKEFAQAVDAVKAGRPDRAAEIVSPTLLKNLMSGVRLTTEGQTSMTGKPINVPGEKGPRKITEGEAFAKAIGFQPLSSTKAFDIYRTLEELKSYRDEKQSELANRYIAAERKGDRKEMVRVREEAREWNRKAHQENRPEAKINIQDAIEVRRKPAQPMKQMRGLSRELREAYGM